ncbi:ABC transporter permease, partial [Ochrobactrum sp. MR34]|nr:ABC transporter permease [Ochrobactrum sp. MR34]
YGLDLPVWQQYLQFMSNLLHGDLGRSFVYNMPVSELIASRLPATAELALTAVFMASLIGIPLGIYAGYKPDSWASKIIMALS